MNKYIASLLRHAITSLGVLLVEHGYATQVVVDRFVSSTTEIVVGIVTALIGLVLSWWDKKKRA